MPFATGFAIVLVAAGAAAAVLTPAAGRLGLRLSLIDVPGGRRKHSRRVPRTGGIALFAAFTLAVVLSLLLPQGDVMPARGGGWQEDYRLRGLLIGAGIAFGVGLLDDRRDLRALPQLAGQIACGLVAYRFLIIIERINSPVDWVGGSEGLIVFREPLILLFTVAWIVGMINTMNFLDGLDGLAAGIVLIAAVVLFAHSAFTIEGEKQLSVALLPLALAGACLGFLVFNLRPATIFMGSSGSYFLGYTLGALSIIGGAKVATVLLVMGVPIVDVAWQTLSRTLRGRSPMSADRGHLYQRIWDRGVEPRRIVYAYWGISVLFGGLALISPPREFKLLALLVLGAATVIVFSHLPLQDDQAPSVPSTASSAEDAATR